MTKPLGMLISAFDIASCAPDKFNDWFDTEHSPALAQLPEVLSRGRWICVDHPKVVLALYDLQCVEVLNGSEYRAIDGNPSPWSRRLMAQCWLMLHFVGEQVTPGDALAPSGAEGLLFMGFNIAPGTEDEYARGMDEEHLLRLSQVPGVLSARRFAATEGSHKYSAVYHLTRPEVCSSSEWLVARETPWTHSIRPQTSDRLRITCRAYARASD